MKTPVRLGAVDYLNARPLVYGIDAAPRRPQPSGPRSRASASRPRPEVRGPKPDLSLRFDLPSVCAKLLAAGDIDLGLIPTIAHFDIPSSRVVPGIGIISDGPVASVAIFTKRPIGEVRSLALDTSSRTSVALTKILCARVFEIAPSFVAHPPDLRAMVAGCDAALLIGDPALFADYRALDLEKVDLGDVWTGWTKRPFVWAFWSGRADAADERVVDRLQSARDAGVAASDSVADGYCAGNAERQAVARRYLRENMKYDLSDAALEGLKTFYREAAALNLIESHDEVRFF